jgi:hypothetical protein
LRAPKVRKARQLLVSANMWYSGSAVITTIAALGESDSDVFDQRSHMDGIHFLHGS